jgi:hypothetical protein
MVEDGKYPAHDQWRKDETDREEDAANLFSLYLIRHCRTVAIKSVSDSSDTETKEAVEKAVDLALHNVMDLLEGFWPLSAGNDLRAEFELRVNVFKENALIESQSISPCKIDLLIGYWSWLEKNKNDAAVES